MHVLRVGSRTSDLAVAQASAEAQAIVDANPELSGFEIVGISTKGDVDKSSLSQIGGTGLFTGAVREALLRDECDIAIHSAKDLPAADHPELSLYFPKRESAHDVFVGHTDYRGLPYGAKIGTGSPRRAAQLRHFRRDIEIVDIRGNVPTRLSRVNEDLDGVILARAGLNRLGIDTGQDLPFEVMVPAAGQGALAIETVAGSRFEPFLEKIDDHTTRLELTAERTFMTTLGAGCSTPIGVLGESTGKTVALHARFTGEGSKIEIRRSSNNPVTLATGLAEEFIKRGVRP